MSLATAPGDPLLGAGAHLTVQRSALVGTCPRRALIVLLLLGALAGAPAAQALRATQPPGHAGCIDAAGSHGCARAAALLQVGPIVVSPNGAFVYAFDAPPPGPDQLLARLLIFARNARTGALRQLPGRRGCLENTFKRVTDSARPVRAGRRARDARGARHQPGRKTSVCDRRVRRKLSRHLRPQPKDGLDAETAMSDQPQAEPMHPDETGTRGTGCAARLTRFTLRVRRLADRISLPAQGAPECLSRGRTWSNPAAVSRPQFHLATRSVARPCRRSAIPRSRESPRRREGASCT